MMEKVLVADEINVTYSMYDRFIFGGAMPVNKELSLDTIDPLKAPYFLFNRELGVINIGGDGIVTVDGKEYELKFKEALYVGRGNQKVSKARMPANRLSSTSTLPLHTRNTRLSGLPSMDARVL